MPGVSAEQLLAFLFGDLTDPETIQSGDPQAHFSYHLESDSGSGLLRLDADEELERECVSEADMAFHLIGQACYQLAYYSSGVLVMHAALVSHGGQGVLFPGSSGKGKSTLAAWLLHCGYDYLTDELVFIPDGDARVGCGLARPVNLKKAAHPLLSDLYQILPNTPGMMTGTTVDLIPPKLFGNGQVLTHVTICAVIFPHYLPGALFELRRISKAQAALDLMQCLINARNQSTDFRT